MSNSRISVGDLAMALNLAEQEVRLLLGEIEANDTNIEYAGDQVEFIDVARLAMRRAQDPMAKPLLDLLMNS